MRDRDAALACHCTCHLRRFGSPTDDLHEAGVSCPCQLTPEEHRATWNAFFAERDAYWASPEGRAAIAARDAERRDDDALAARLGMTFTVESEFAPLILAGELDGHGYWFRERHGAWRLHRDDLDGPVIADGTGDPSVREALLLVAEHLDRDIRGRSCEHPTGPADVFCPRCGTRLSELGS